MGLILQPHFEGARNQRILVRHFFAKQLALLPFAHDARKRDERKGLSRSLKNPVILARKRASSSGQLVYSSAAVQVGSEEKKTGDGGETERLTVLPVRPRPDHRWSVLQPP